MSEVSITKAIKGLIDPLLDEASCPEKIPESKSPFDRLLSTLIHEMPLVHQDGIIGIDWFHIVYYRTLRDTLYLGCMLEQKRQRKIFSDDWYNVVENTLLRAFQMGKEYAITRERRSNT